MRAGKHNASRGVSLVEAMVALAVMAFGMLAVVGVQSTLRLNGDIAKQRSEATRIAQETLEKGRSFQVIDSADKGAGQTAWEEIVSRTQDITPANSSATYHVESTVTTYTDPPAKAMRVTVSWNDRAGQRQEVLLSSSIAAAAPALSGTLGRSARRPRQGARCGARSSGIRRYRCRHAISVMDEVRSCRRSDRGWYWCSTT